MSRTRWSAIPGYSVPVPWIRTRPLRSNSTSPVRTTSPAPSIRAWSERLWLSSLMTRATRVSVVVTSTLVALAIGAAVFVGSGIYNIGADDHHTRIVLAIIEQLRDRSIAARARAIAVPGIEDPEKIGAGAQRYATLCVGCHLAPGVTKSDLRPGLYPH